MKMSLTKDELFEYVNRQLNFFIPDEIYINSDILMGGVELALERCDICFSHILISGYRCLNKNDDGEYESNFSHLHMDQYATFLYFLMNSIYVKYNDANLCDKILNLNRILNGFFISYKCKMPPIFVFAHPVGSIIGNAQYSDFLYISQNVTINTNLDLKIGKCCFLGAGAKIIGSEIIEDRVSVGVDALIYNRYIPADSVCMRGENGELIVNRRRKSICMAEKVFDIQM